MNLQDVISGNLDVLKYVYQVLFFWETSEELLVHVKECMPVNELLEINNCCKLFCLEC